MKIILVLVALIALTSAAKVKKPIDQYFADFAGEDDIHLITGEDNGTPTNFVGDVMKAQTTSIKTLTGAKKFNYNFETENGIKVASIGKLKDEKTFVVTGSYTYTGADGKRYRVRYTADEFGYHPVTEEDTEPEIEFAPAPVAAQRFSPVSSSQYGNQFRNQNNQFGGQNGQFGQVGGYSPAGQFGQSGQFGKQNSQYGQNGFQGYAGNGQNNGIGRQNSQYNQYGNQNNQYSGQTGVLGGQNGVNGNSGFGYNNGQRNGFGGSVNAGRNGVANGYNTVNRFGSYDRTGKSLEEGDLVYNKDFITASIVPQDPNRLYLPAASTYLSPQ